MAEDEQQLSDSKTCKEVQLSEKDQIKLVEKSNSMFKELKKKTVIKQKTENREREKFLVIGNLYLLPKRLSNVPGSPVISNCGTPTEKSFGILRSSFAGSNERMKVVQIQLIFLINLKI